MAKVYSISQTIACLFITFVLGLCFAIIGPTLPYLMHRTNSNYEGIANALAIEGIGFVVGSLLGGYLANTFPRHYQLTIAAGLWILAISTICVPYCTTLTGLSAVLLIHDLGGSHIASAGSALLAIVSGRFSVCSLHCYHAVFGIGSFLAPQIAQPFLSVMYKSQYANSTELSNTTAWHSGPARNCHGESGTTCITPYSQNTTGWTDGAPGFLPEGSRPTKVFDSPIEMPYMIVGLLAGLDALAFTAFYIYEMITDDRADILGEEVESKSVETVWEVLDPKTCTGVGGRCYGVLAFTCIFMLYFNFTGGEHMFWRFIFSYAMEMEHMGFTVSEATWLNTGYGIGFSVGRFVTGPIASVVHQKILWPLFFIGNVGIGIVLTIWGHQERVVVWICSIGAGLFIGPLFPIGQGWCRRYFNMTPMGTSIIFCGAGSGILVYSYIEGYLFQNYGSMALPWGSLGFSVICLLFLVLLQCMASRQGEYKANTHHQTEEEMRSLRAI